MRNLVDRKSCTLASRAAALALVAGAAAGCSSGFSRFDQGLYSSTATPPAATQNSAAQAYPGDIDPTATSSIGAAGQHPLPPQDVGGYAAPAAGSAQGVDVYQQQANLQQQSYQAPAAAYGQTATNGATIQRNTLASPVEGASAYAKPPLLAPASGAVDPIQTSSAQTSSAQTGAAMPKTASAAATAQSFAAATPEPQPKQAVSKPAGNERGWTANGGTKVTLRDGETIYNLSKRYGVPVKAIMAANGIEDANLVKAGQAITIPTYVFSRNAPVSAPDNDPATLAASASRGTATDTMAAVEKTLAATPAKPAGAAGGSVTVAAGDSLARIAEVNGVSVAALKTANGLTEDSIRIGQVLRLPSAKPGEEIAKVAPAVDPATTATVSADPKPKPYVKPQVDAPGEKTASNSDLSAPARTGIEEFRWPVRGRVISSFGEKTDKGRNDGIDISVPEGTAVKAAENGVVVYAGDELEGLGNLVLVRHADGWVSAYAHNKQIDVARGDEVKRGQTIARSGRTGAADMPMLHFELRKNSTPVDPLKHLGGA